MDSKLNRKNKIFIGSSTEGKDIAYKVIEELKKNGFSPLPWFDCFKNSRPPLQELEQISLRVDGAIFVGTMDDRAVIRKQEWTQMRDNVLYEYGLFSGIMGRSKCGLLVPNRENFKIPSDFLGVSCYESYSSNNIQEVISTIIDSLKKLLLKPKSNETITSRGRRLLQFVSWIRNESFRLAQDWNNETGRELISNRIIAISGFIQDDINKLNLYKEYQEVEEVVLESAKRFPKYSRNRNYQDLEYGLDKLVEGIPPNPDVIKGLLYRLEREGAFEYCYQGCEKCNNCYQSSKDWFNRRRNFNYYDNNYRYKRWRIERKNTICHFEAWAIGVAEAATYFEHLTRSNSSLAMLEEWSKEFLPKLDKTITKFEHRLHEEIFGKL